MTLSWEETCRQLDVAAGLLNDTGAVHVDGPVHVGIDLGTADVVLMALNDVREPVACFLEWAEVVRDGVVVDFIGAVEIVKRHLDKAQERLGREITSASTSFPPGTDARLSTNILESAGLDVLAVADEPTCVAKLLHLDGVAVVDVGGGTTGTAVVQGGRVIFSGDEPSGGRHITLVVSGHFDIPFDEAELRKRESRECDVLSLARPTLERISDIVAEHIREHEVNEVILTGGTCCLAGIEKVFGKELGLPVRLPNHPLLLTPLAIGHLAAAASGASDAA